MDNLLQKLGYKLKYSELTPDEKETVHEWAEKLNKKGISITDVRDYVARMRGAVEKELTVTGLNNKQDTFLKARLKNYMLLDDFLMGPIKAKEALKRQTQK